MKITLTSNEMSNVVMVGLTCTILRGDAKYVVSEITKEKDRVWGDFTIELYDTKDDKK